MRLVAYWSDRPDTGCQKNSRVEGSTACGAGAKVGARPNCLTLCRLASPTHHFRLTLCRQASTSNRFRQVTRTIGVPSQSDRPDHLPIPVMNRGLSA